MTNEKNFIKYPIALNIKTEKLINIEDVNDDNKKGLVCPVCKENFIAVRMHETPHFKHKPNTKCKGAVESYIHCITKEIFKEIKEIELPEILIKNLIDHQEKKLYNELQILIREKVPEFFIEKFRKILKLNLTKSENLQIEKIEIEKEYKTDLGNIRVDIVTTIKNQQLFIEPHYLNQIDDNKLEKLIKLEKSTLSINLLKFISENDYKYNLEMLKDYLISKNSKNWIYIREVKIEKYIKEYLNYVSVEIINQKNNFDRFSKEYDKMIQLQEKVKYLEEKIKPTQDEIYKIKSEIKNIKAYIDGIDL